MSDKTVTEREAVLRERAAFFEGAQAAQAAGDWTLEELGTPQRVAERYPLPSVTRRRELRIGEENDFRVRVRADATLDFPFEYNRSDMGGVWRAMSVHRKYATPGTVYGDLLLAPDETVPDVG